MSDLYGIAYSKAALDSLEKIPKKFRRQIVSKAKKLVSEPQPQGSRKVIGADNGDSPVYRIRSGDYRLLYSIRPGPQIVVLDIGHRKDIYRSLK